MAKPKSVSRSGRPSEISVGASEGESRRRESQKRDDPGRRPIPPPARQAAPDQAEPVALKIDDRRPAVSRIKRGMDLNQAAELTGTQLEHPIETSDMSTANRVPHPKRVAHDKDLTPEIRPA